MPLRVGYFVLTKPTQSIVARESGEHVVAYQPPSQDPKPPATTTAASSDADPLKSLQSTMSHPFRWGFVAGGVVAVAVALLIVQNGESVQVDWLWIDFRARLWMVLLLTVAAGGLIWETTKAVVRRAKASNQRRSEALKELQAANKGRRGRRKP